MNLQIIEKYRYLLIAIALGPALSMSGKSGGFLSRSSLEHQKVDSSADALPFLIVGLIGLVASFPLFVYYLTRVREKMGGWIVFLFGMFALTCIRRIIEAVVVMV